MCVLHRCLIFVLKFSSVLGINKVKLNRGSGQLPFKTPSSWHHWKNESHQHLEEAYTQRVTESFPNFPTGYNILFDSSSIVFSLNPAWSIEVAHHNFRFDTKYLSQATFDEYLFVFRTFPMISWHNHLPRQIPTVSNFFLVNMLVLFSVLSPSELIASFSCGDLERC